MAAWPSRRTAGVFGAPCPGAPGTRPLLPMNGSTTTLNTWASTCIASGRAGPGRPAAPGRLAAVERRRVAFGRDWVPAWPARPATAARRRRCAPTRTGSESDARRAAPLERRVQLLRAGVGAVLQVARHQVSSSSMIWSISARCAAATEAKSLSPCHGRAVPPLFRTVVHRQVQQQALLAKALADVGHQRRQVDVVGIDLVDDDHAAQAALAGQPRTCARSRARCRSAH
jgi:hypothetical protein